MSIKEVLKSVEHDSTLYAGMLAYLGDTEAEDYLHSCVTKGKIYRTPEAAERDANYTNCSSRDMFMGVLLGANFGTILSVINYLGQNKGRLFPDVFATDNRNKVGVIGWGQLWVALGVLPFFDKLSLVKEIGAIKYIGHMLLGRLLLGLVLVIEALTVYKPYQINLVYCALMFYRKHGVFGFWDKLTMKVLYNVRLKDDGVMYYLLGNKHKVLTTMRNVEHNCEQTKLNVHGPAFGWPPGCEPYYFAHIYPSELYVRWMKLASKQINK